MTHEDAQELAGLYVLGALSPEEQSAFEAHVSACIECQREVASFHAVAMGLLQAVPQRTPPPDLRRRVLDAATRGRSAGAGSVAGTWTNRLHWLATAAALVVAVASILIASRSMDSVRLATVAAQRAREQAAAAETRASDVQRRLNEAAASLSVVTAPDVVRIELAGQAPAPSAVARAYWSRSRGLVFTASHLPAAPPSRTYQLWVVTAAAPVSAGLLQANQAGDVSAIFRTPSDIPSPIAVAVTLERVGGVPSPTGEKYLVGVPPR